MLIIQSKGNYIEFKINNDTLFIIRKLNRVIINCFLLDFLIEKWNKNRNDNQIKGNL